MKRPNRVSVCLVLVTFALSACEKDQYSGPCRLRSLSGGHKYVFKYSNDGRLLSYNQPWTIGCLEQLSYDDEGRLIKRVTACPTSILQQVEFNYDNPVKVIATIQESSGPQGHLEIYYNSQKRADSIYLFGSQTGVEPARLYIYYNGGNMSSGLYMNGLEEGFRKKITNIKYDDGLNPFDLLQRSANYMGLESLAEHAFSFANPASFSQNNVIEFQYREYYETASGEIVDEKITNYTHAYDYKENFPYPVKITSLLNDKGEQQAVFSYEGCH
jgi:hypothetical protein